MALCLVAMMGMLGVVIDIGRAYICKNETQVYTDSAALAATMELDGTSSGVQRALDQVAANTNHWNLATTPFAGTQVSFGQSPTGPWVAYPPNPNGYRYTRVLAAAPMSLFFLPAVTNQAVPGAGFLMLSSAFLNISANSAGGQEVETVFREGLLPFSPYAHDASPGAAPHFGLVPGNMYTLRWAANVRLDRNTCPGDNSQQMIDLSNAGGGSERGYIEDTSASVIRAAIETDYQTFTRQVGDSVNMTGGAKQTELTALQVRIGQDSDPDATSYANYMQRAHGNGRRLVGVPINTGHPRYTIVQIGAFLLQPANQYDPGGNSPWCAEYVGAWVKGAKNKGANDSGAYLARLVK